MAANPAACAMLDMSDEAICALGRDGLVDQEDPRWGIAVAERERTGSAVGVARLRRGDGRFIEIEMTALQFRDDGGTAQTCCILRDLSGRMAIERELEELSARLLQLSRGDELTGFQNRRGLIATGTQLLQFADREGAAGPCALRRCRQRATAQRAPRPPGRRRHAAGGGPRPVGDLSQERRAGPHRRHAIPRADGASRGVRMCRHDRPHPRTPRRPRDAGSSSAPRWRSVAAGRRARAASARRWRT